MAKLQKIAEIQSFLPQQGTADKSWGGQSEWSNRLSLMWRSIGAADYRVRYVPGNDVLDEVGWWFAAVHLLAFGMGWTDIGLGLERWRKQGYPKDHPVLKTVADTFGPSVEALEIWFLSGNGDQIFYSLVRHAHFFGEMPASQRPRSADSDLDLSSRIVKFNHQTAGPRSQRAAEIFLGGGGSDTLHLASHFTSFVEEEFDNSKLDPNWLTRTETDWAVLKILRIPNFVGLNSFFKRYESEIFRGIGMGQRLAVLLAADELAMTLQFDFNFRTKRWHLATPSMIDYWHRADAPNNLGSPLLR